MKLYQLTIKPLAPFGTPLKGDTIFGHFCWQIAYNPALLNGGLDEWMKKYDSEPFAICSSAFPLIEDREAGEKIAFPCPQLPPALLDASLANLERQKKIEAQKKLKQKKWLLTDANRKIRIHPEFLLTDSKLFECYHANLSENEQAEFLVGKSGSFFLVNPQAHNSIDRLRGTTGGGDGFAPFSCENITWFPGVKLAVLVLIDEVALDEERLRLVFARIGKWGFGRDASAGLGRFELVDCQERSLPDAKEANACFTLSPSVPEAGLYRRQYFIPFTRFGRHGDRLARSKNPFKAPVVMADEGAVFVPHDRHIFSSPYLGRAVHGVSLVQPNAVVQGYSLYLPCEVAI